MALLFHFQLIHSQFPLSRYFGRKRIVNQEEKWVEDSEQLVHAGYSYWTLGYALSLSGAKKLLGLYFRVALQLVPFANKIIRTNRNRCTPAWESHSCRWILTSYVQSACEWFVEGGFSEPKFGCVERSAITFVSNTLHWWRRILFRYRRFWLDHIERYALLRLSNRQITHFLLEYFWAPLNKNVLFLA